MRLLVVDWRIIKLKLGILKNDAVSQVCYSIYLIMLLLKILITDNCREFPSTTSLVCED